VITAIVLAGGRSTRFGADKLAPPQPGTPDRPGASLQEAAHGAVARIADEVVVAGPALPDDLSATDLPVRLLEDPEPFGGPLQALAHVLANIGPEPHHLAIVVGGDMPRLVPAVLARMLDVLDVDPTVDAVYLARPGPSAGAAGSAPAAIATDRTEPRRRQVLPLALRIQPAARASREAVEAGRRSLQALVDAMAAIELPSAAWTAMDPRADTLVDIDTPADLDRQKAT
jgi:molybdopterin-guanine dinucleotide biosynthesis protein A